MSSVEVGDTVSFDGTQKKDPLLNIDLDSTLIISYANYFAETKEFAVMLYYQAGSDYYIDAGKLDSTVFEGELVTRRRLPIEDASDEFYLQGLDSVFIYSENHVRVAKVALTRVESVDEETASYFAAVYNATGVTIDADNTYYCISANYAVPIIENFSTVEISDVELNNRIVESLKLDSSQNWVMHHVKVLPSEKIYSAVSLDSQSFIVETTDDGSKILKDVGEDYYYSKIFPVPILVNGKPLLLVSFAVAESDVEGDFLAVFNGTAYETAEYSRLKLKHLRSQR